MPRQLRIEYPGAIYHVMHRGNRRKLIFQDDFDRKTFCVTLPCFGGKPWLKFRLPRTGGFFRKFSVPQTVWGSPDVAGRGGNIHWQPTNKHSFSMNTGNGKAAHEVLQAVYRDHPPKQIADYMEMRPTSISKWAETCDPDAVSPVERTGRLLEYLGEDDRLIQYLCQRAGGHFVKNPQPETSLAALAAAVIRLNHEQAEFQAVVTAAAENGHITNREAMEVRSHWDHVKSVTEGFVQACERGAFRLLALCLTLDCSFTVDAAPVLAVA